MTLQDWDNERSNLRVRFTTGDITKAKRKELERYLVVLANANPPGGINPHPSYNIETETFATVVRHLLQVRLGEELHWRSIKVSGIAIVISLLAAGFAGWQAFEKHQENVNKEQSHISAGTNSPPHTP